jgi:hypothetical protein
MVNIPRGRERRHSDKHSAHTAGGNNGQEQEEICEENVLGGKKS